MLFVLWLDLLLLVARKPVQYDNGLVHDYLCWRYPTKNTHWCCRPSHQISLLVLCSLGLLCFFSWRNLELDPIEVAPGLVLLLDSIFVAAMGSFSGFTRPWCLQPYAVLLVACVIWVMSWTVLVLVDHSTIASSILRGLILTEGVVYFASLVVVLSTWYAGRPGHTPSSSRKETSDSDPYSIDFIDLKSLSLQVIATDACLGMSVCPGRHHCAVVRDLEKDLTRISQHYDIHAIVSLNPPEQLLELEVPNLCERVRSFGMESHSEGAWRDKWWPSTSSLRLTHDTVSVVIDRLCSPSHASTSIPPHLVRARRVLVHCNGGKGRTGVIIVGTLLRLGLSLPRAIHAIRTARVGCIHNPSQILFLLWYSQYLATLTRTGYVSMT
jgi:hypothetical protein